MKIAILTSSRADFGIYYPLVKKLWENSLFELEIIAFGTHLKEEFGNTINEILNYGFEVKHRIDTITKNKGAFDISFSMGDTVRKFAAFWNENKFDLIFALGDRYEMFAAVSASSPFNIDIAHIHAGETTLGAIDNSFRHSISLMSKYLFVSTDAYKKRAEEINHNPDNVFNVGALSIDNLQNQDFFSKDEFIEKFHIDLSKPTILSTFHPETVCLSKNEEYITQLLMAFNILQKRYQIVITMPNVDTMGDMIRKKITEFGKQNTEVKLIESFGMKGYLTAMKYCKILIGNTSSGFVEAAFFPKWVINIGDRQKGRLITDNIINSIIKRNNIIDAVAKIEESNIPVDSNIYGDGNTANNIISKIKILYGLK